MLAYVRISPCARAPFAARLLAEHRISAWPCGGAAGNLRTDDAAVLCCLRPDDAAEVMLFLRRRHSGDRIRHAGLLCYVVLALAWAALGPSPWLVFAAMPHGSHAHHHHAAAQAHHHDQLDPSEIPGSPLHPDDHGCAACQLLQHLSRAKPAAAGLLLVAPVQVLAFTLPQSPALAARSVDRVWLPRVRGPPAQFG